MPIDQYNFGRIEIAGITYTSDVIIASRRVRDNWQRKLGHRLQIEDLEPVLAFTPDILVVGTGYYGRMTVPEETCNYLEAKGVSVVSAPTREAIDGFNRLQRDYANIVAALHLTC